MEVTLEIDGVPTMSDSAFRTSTVVHASEVDTPAKYTDLVEQLGYRLERRAGRPIFYVAYGPSLIRRARNERGASGAYLVEVCAS